MIPSLPGRRSSRLVSDVTGRNVSIFVEAHNVRERRRHEQALIESERRHREFCERAPAILHSIDMQGRLPSVSDLWLMGYSRDEVLGRSSSDFL